MPKGFIWGAILALVLLASPSQSKATTVFLSFSGGAGAPLTINISSQVDMLILQDSNYVFITFKNVGNVVPQQPSGTGTTGYVTSEGDSGTFSSISSNFSSGDTGVNDIYFSPDSGSLTVATGDIVSLLAGSYTTNQNILPLRPSDGNYEVFVGNVSGQNISTTPVPEPSGGVMVLSLGVLGLSHRRRPATPRVSASSMRA